ncbi:helix-turn-helix DNA binding protein [Gordonia phage Huffy]|uniref:Helix-turn-helix DNA-binding protein n=1 Tax=Gordonia phage TZGordon TaxID=2744004 RepID=A0A6N0A7X1_9CAUD|nr:helix-turn-helix DNA binding protein [Gordonia phage TZGordon]AQY55650.1 helix-turn-helix DNA binding protein [Gordonia phage Huffy]AQY55732.1 helix-turn-helix DNA binding protein [Gordonia phage DinoDaryn]QKO02968.1 helix-turn-helix DNA-binding protein [Gordonia phage TZGordon]
MLEIPRDVMRLVESNVITLSDLGVLVVLSAIADEAGRVVRSYRDLAVLCGYRKSDSVAERLRSLESAGLIEREGRTGFRGERFANMYQLTYEGAQSV